MFKRIPACQASHKFWQQPGGERWKKGEGKTTPFASGHMVKGTELKRRSKEAKKGREKPRCFSESGLRKGGQDPESSSDDKAVALRNSGTL